MPSFIDLTGRRYGKLVVLNRDENNKGRNVKWVCVCDCGSQTTVCGNDLKAGKTVSCGCLRKEGSHRTHSMSRTRLYRIWGNMKSRCTNSNVKQYKDYGARGITVCQEWMDSFETFKEWAMANGYSEELTIDRIDVNGNYNPSNCRWITRKEQSLNRTDNHWLNYKGETKTIAEWSAITGIHRATIESRLRNGMTTEQALEKAL